MEQNAGNSLSKLGDNRDRMEKTYMAMVCSQRCKAILNNRVCQWCCMSVGMWPMVLYVNICSFCPLWGFGKLLQHQPVNFERYLRNNYDNNMNYDTLISAVPSQILAYALRISCWI